MRKHTFTPGRIGFVLAALGTLAACGGGGGGSAIIDDPDFAAFADRSSQDSAMLRAASLDAGARTTAGLTGTLDRADDTASIGSLSGTINATRSEVALTSGGAVTFDPNGNLFSTRYIATPTTANRTVGVVGIATPVPSLPTGTTTLTGPATVTIQDGSLLYDLTGDASVAANFRTDRVRTTLNALDGSRTNGLTAGVPVTDVATVVISGSVISDNAFSGGAVRITSTSLSDLSDDPTTSINGAFFGPEGEEAGGVVALDDTQSGSLRLFGDFIVN